MFTGIIEATGEIREKTDAGLTVERPNIFDDLKIGCSIAVSGACLSVISFDDRSISFDVVPTTLQKTKLGSLRKGDRVNLERAMRADGRLEGHIVAGHVEGVGEVVACPHSQAPTPGPSPRLLREQRGEGGVAVSQFSQLCGRVWQGTDESKYSPHVLVERARQMRRQPTEAENRLWQELRGKKINGIRFRRQHPIGLYIVDFYSDALKLVIEVDGGIHDDVALKEYELHRTGDLNSRGISVMRFSNDDILHRLNDVLIIIHSFNDAPLTRLSELSSESEDPGEGLGVGAVKEARRGGTEGPGVGAEKELVRLGTEGSGLGEVKEAAQQSEAPMLKVRIPSHLLPYIVHHGSITLDGVALTVAELHGREVTVALIPLTTTNTTLGAVKIGDILNIETDVLAKYILKSHEQS